jgi:molybdopterin molybdotransferase
MKPIHTTEAFTGKSLMITVKEALQIILDATVPLRFEKIAILDSQGRVLAEDVYAPRDIPPRDNSAMDGFGLVSEDTAGASKDNPLLFDIIEEIPAGSMPEKIVGFAEAVRIMTGAPIPEGVDAVIPVENAEVDGNQVKILEEARMGQNVRYRGEDVKEGERVFSRGRIIRPAEIGMLASLGRSFVQVYQKPLVAIMTSGDELIDVDGVATSEKIISSNTYSGAAQVMECGAVPMLVGIARDAKEDLIAKFTTALRADVIVSSAGVSVGDHDYVKDVMKEIGVTIDFHRVAQRPGRPFTFGRAGEKLFFGLPGNPVSSMVTFEEYVRPALLKMSGHSRMFRRTITAVLKEDIKKNKGLRFFVRGMVTIEDGNYYVATTGEQGSGILKSMVLANGIIVLPEDITHCKAGDTVTVQLIDRSFEADEQPAYL